MAWTWLGSFLYGLLSGITELLPISSDVHQRVFRLLTGMPDGSGSMALAVHLGAFLALLTVYRGRIGKLLRERRIAKIPARKRKRQPDIPSLMELRLSKVALLPLLISAFLSAWMWQQSDQLWILGLLVICNGLLLMLPQYRVRANKDARSLSGLDALLVGLGGFVAALPGISYVTALTTVGQIRGMDRQFSLNFTYLLLLPVLLCLCIGDGSLLIMGNAATAAWYHCVTAGVASFTGALGAIQLMRFLAVKVGFHEFASYCWGIGLFSCILYLIV